MEQQIKQKHYSAIEAALAAYKSQCSAIAQQAQQDLKKAAGNRELLKQVISTQKEQLENAYIDLKNTIDRSQKSFFVDVENVARSQDEANLTSMEKLLGEA